MDSGNTGFLIICTALVLMMTPALAFFYGGLVRAKSVISMMMLSFGSMAIIGVLWILYGYAIAFPELGAETVFGIPGFFAVDIAHLGLENLLTVPEGASVPPLVFAAFQATFAIITVALISGAIADRARFGAWLVFAGVWATIVYFPVASWVFDFTVDPLTGEITNGGWLVHDIGALDFAGGTVVEINSGAAALALALVLGKRIGFSKGLHKPHNVPFVLLGAGLLWFGWFGFNAGSAIAADGIASIALINTLAAPAAGIIGWLIVERIKDGKATSVGAASGAVSGLVAATPSCAYLTPFWSLVLGFVTGILCALAVELKYTFGVDDSLDVVGIHLVGGLIGTLFIGLVSFDAGLLYTGSFEQLGKQGIAAFSVLIYSFGMTYLIGWGIEKTIGFRVKNEDELAGIDTVIHSEAAYAMSED